MSEIPTGEQAIFWLCISQCSTAGPELSLAAPGLQCECETSWGSDCTVCSLKHRAALQDAERAGQPSLAFSEYRANVLSGTVGLTEGNAVHVLQQPVRSQP